MSFRLVRPVEKSFPGSCHLRDVGLARADDRAVWEFAKQHGFAIITLDSDFHERSLLEGWPPKIVWLRIGNTATRVTERLRSSRAVEIAGFLADADDACLVIST